MSAAASHAAHTSPAGLEDWRGVWIAVELERGRVHPVSWELLGEGRKLAAHLGVPLCAAVVGPDESATADACAEAIFHGADCVYVVRHPVLAHYRTAPFTTALTRLVERYRPEILLLGATTLGRDLAGAVATTLATGLTADCTELRIDGETRSLAATRPTFGGSLLCTIHTLRCRPQMATVRPRVMAMPARDTQRTGRIIPETIALDEDDIVTKVLAFIPDAAAEEAQLAYADIVVAGGRGLGGPANFRLVTDLARVVGGDYGGSRPVAQAGWIGLERQIGQTGKTIRPKLYIAAGISGAVQHRVGVEGADVIVAINSDPDAPIFEFATYGIVGDALRILPALTEALRARSPALAAAD
ncbi:MAG: electron transfer flavoprotein subunit alpha/FixB family protein [Pseudorhodoplanes sp.]|nr:Caffeyl-CoA reductase-Etf complex subunit CarE [Pseudorhodoplanes sp.]MCL4713172.1 electron transfer flavoprotein subunit alpha/FixB family protein [Pseudorhodoplanes sp.]GIK79067.1 MAG: protein FixB [Alphaproteobacteria bacterium]